jgi:hypothetical protein
MKYIIYLLLIVAIGQGVYSIFQGFELRRLKQSTKEQRIYTIKQIDSIVSVQNAILQNKMDSLAKPIVKRIIIIKKQAKKHEIRIDSINATNYKPPLF